ncbi:MAG: GNAT family N-acetyltransferase [Dehalococcoidia bacterium]
MRSGVQLKTVELTDGREAVLRTPRWEDLDDFLDFIHALIDEEVDITILEKPTRESEAEWLANRLRSMESGRVIAVVGEVDGKVVANSEVMIKPGRMSHVGLLGISVSHEYRDVGLGYEMMKTLIEESRKEGLEVLVLDVFATNRRAIYQYEKVGFRHTGMIPKGIKRNRKHIDLLRMALEL